MMKLNPLIFYQILASVSDDAFKIIWNYYNDQVILFVVIPVLSLDLLYNEQLVSTGAEIKIWDLNYFSCILTLNGHTDPEFDLIWLSMVP